MNLDLLSMNGVLSLVSSSEVAKCLVIDKKTSQVESTEELPPLKDVLKGISPLPEEALFLGLADDGLPVLLNLWDPLPGPILLVGDPKAGKTDFLKAIARFVVSTHQAQDIQYGVITANPHEWDGYVNYPHCVGIFSMAQTDVADFIRALSVWIDVNTTNEQSVLLLIDGLDDFANCDGGLSRCLQKILLYGPVKGIWPLATINLERFHDADAWLEYFHVRVFGYTKHFDVMSDNNHHHTGFETLSRGIEFTLKEDSQWIKFRIPRT